MKLFSMENRVYVPWIALEDEELLHNYLTWGPEWKCLTKSWGTRSAFQLKIDSVKL
jgi:hypothetical protein